MSSRNTDVNLVLVVVCLSLLTNTFSRSRDRDPEPAPSRGYVDADFAPGLGYPGCVDGVCCVDPSSVVGP